MASDLKLIVRRFKQDTKEITDLVSHIERAFVNSVEVSRTSLVSIMDGSNNLPVDDFYWALFKGYKELPSEYYFLSSHKDKQLKSFIDSLDRLYKSSPTEIIDVEKHFSRYVEAMYLQFVLVIDNL